MRRRELIAWLVAVAVVSAGLGAGGAMLLHPAAADHPSYQHIDWSGLFQPPLTGSTSSLVPVTSAYVPVTFSAQRVDEAVQNALSQYGSAQDITCPSVPDENGTVVSCDVGAGHTVTVTVRNDTLEVGSLR